MTHQRCHGRSVPYRLRHDKSLRVRDQLNLLILVDYKGRETNETPPSTRTVLLYKNPSLNLVYVHPQTRVKTGESTIYCLKSIRTPYLYRITEGEKMKTVLLLCGAEVASSPPTRREREDRLSTISQRSPLLKKGSHFVMIPKGDLETYGKLLKIPGV